MLTLETWVLVSDPEVQLAKTLSGEIDISRVNISTPANRGVMFQNMEQGNYRFVTANSADKNVADLRFPLYYPADPVKAEDLFRQELSASDCRTRSIARS